MTEISKNRLLILLLSFDFLLTVFLALFTEDSRKYYKEGQLITIYSGLKLVVISYFSWKIFGTRKRAVNINSFNNSTTIWLIMSVGFLFLALDELALIHENIDKLIHYLFDIEESSLSDRIDDLIIFLYAVIGIYILYKYKDEILLYNFFIKYIIASLILLFVMIVADVLTNTPDILLWFIPDRNDYKPIKDTLDYIEEITKLFSESVLIFAFYDVKKHLSNSHNMNSHL